MVGCDGTIEKYNAFLFTVAVASRRRRKT